MYGNKFQQIKTLLNFGKNNYNPCVVNFHPMQATISCLKTAKLKAGVPIPLLRDLMSSSGLNVHLHSGMLKDTDRHA